MDESESEARSPAVSAFMAKQAAASISFVRWDDDALSPSPSRPLFLSESALLALLTRRGQNQGLGGPHDSLFFTSLGRILPSLLLDWFGWLHFMGPALLRTAS